MLAAPERCGVHEQCSTPCEWSAVREKYIEGWAVIVRSSRPCCGIRRRSCWRRVTGGILLAVVPAPAEISYIMALHWGRGRGAEGERWVGEGSCGIRRGAEEARGS